MKKMNGLVLAAAGLIVFASACESSGAGGRRVEITQSDDGCTPASIAVTAGEKLNLVVKNESSSDAFEVEGIEGTKLEEFVVHKGKTRSAGYTVPSGAGTHKVKCYVPAGTSTIIELVASGASSTGTTGAATPAASGSPSAGDSSEVDSSVAVTLTEYLVTPDKPSVATGKIRFTATNASKDEVHELAVLKAKTDGTFENMGEVEDIDPEKGGSVVLDLEPGAYQLACLITIGEEGSTVDHYKQGMHTEFTVQ
jgi:uncharacterized cupredoxin-like copper-binding protein